MATLTLRSVKGSPLTNAEVDGNFTALNDELATKLASSSYTAADVLTKIKTVDGTGSGLDADTLDGYETATTNTANTIVLRNGTGGFSAGAITATSFSGPLTGAVTGNVTGNVSGTAGGLSATLAVASGGTGATDAGTARTNLGLGSMATQNSNAVSISGGTISALTTALPIAAGGTGANNASAARTALGLSIGVDVQAYDGDLVALAGLATTGHIVRTGTNTVVTRSIVGGSNITVTNGDGVSGNPTISFSQDLSTTASIQFGSLGIGTAPSGTSGEIRATNQITSYYSDERLKTNVQLIENALDKVVSLRGVTYEPNSIAESFGYKKESMVGVIAQDVERVLPQAVKPAPFDIMLFENTEMSRSGENYKTVQYEKIVPLLIEAIKELNIEVKKLKGFE